MTLPKVTFQAYKRWRRKGHCTRGAFAMAKAESECTIDLGYYGETWTGEFDGFDVTVKVEPDVYCDTSMDGEFTDTWCEGALENPHADWHNETDYRGREYRTLPRAPRYFVYFVPTYPETELRRDLIRYYGKTVATERARELVQNALKRAIGPEQYIVTVTVRQDGVEVAETCIGGVEVDDSPELFVWMELLPEAIAEARYNIDKIVANNPKVA